MLLHVIYMKEKRIYIYVVADVHSQGRPEGYYTVVEGRVLLLPLDGSTLTLLRTL